MNLDTMDSEIEEEIEQCETTHIHQANNPVWQGRRSVQEIRDYKAWLRAEKKTAKGARQAKGRPQRGRQGQPNDGRAFCFKFWMTVSFLVVVGFLVCGGAMPPILAAAGALLGGVGLLAAWWWLLCRCIRRSTPRGRVKNEKNDSESCKRAIKDEAANYGVTIRR